MGETFGVRTNALVERVRGTGVDSMTLLMRHSAREYAPGRHDLENPLTEAGRQFARDFGLRLAPELTLRAYASPVARCIDTADLIHAAQLERGGRGAGGCRPVEALGVFYVLDQMRMFKALSANENGLPGFVQTWIRGQVPDDVLMAPRAAAATLTKLLARRLAGRDEGPALDLCVSHDITLYLMRDVLLALDPTTGPVRYLDGIALWWDGDRFMAATHDHDARDVSVMLT